VNKLLKILNPVLLLPLLLGACSTGQLVVRGTQTILDSGILAMNRETDLALAEAAMPANLKLLEGMLIEDPGNHTLRLYAAEGFYGYSYGFIETTDRARASALYRRCYDHAVYALHQTGFASDPLTATSADLQAAAGALDKAAVADLFWTASCLGKWIDMNRDRVVSIAALGNAAVLMERVLELDDAFYHAGGHLFFGVYYGGRAPMLGGDYTRAAGHFQRAREINQGKLLLVDLLQAEFLHRQQFDRDAFHQALTGILDAPDDLYPDMAMVNAIAKQKAGLLLEQEDTWF
jgi:hypothetical protein